MSHLYCYGPTQVFARLTSTQVFAHFQDAGVESLRLTSLNDRVHMDSMGRQRNPKKTSPLSEWLDRHPKVDWDEFASKLGDEGIDRKNLNRLVRGDRRPGLDLAFDIEDLTRELSKGRDILHAEIWRTPKA